MLIVCVKKQKCAVYKYLIFVPIPKISTRGFTYFMVTSASLPGGSRGGLDTSNHINKHTDHISNILGQNIGSNGKTKNYSILRALCKTTATREIYIK